LEESKSRGGGEGMEEREWRKGEADRYKYARLERVRVVSEGRGLARGEMDVAVEKTVGGGGELRKSRDGKEVGWKG